MNDPKTGVYFHEKCLEISRLTADRKGEMSANHLLGTAYDKMVGVNDNLHSRIGQTIGIPPQDLDTFGQIGSRSVRSV